MMTHNKPIMETLYSKDALTEQIITTYHEAFNSFTIQK